ncbi:MAG TPA: hypothetical protein VNY05_33330 [Candidatus Acidoferrales bacterium]|nr:hypothetical protein [Candidatus Acidoferrales bacterium]
MLSLLAWTCVAPAQTGGSSQPESASSSPSTPATQPENTEDKRIFGVLPNNRTTENSLPFVPISAKRKMTIAYKDSFDWPVYPTAAAFATLYQVENQNPSFGQGMAGYAKRFGTAYGDQMIGNMMTEGIVPSLLHEDPRYFRLGEGTKASRVGYALKQILVTRTDSGHKTFNFAEFGGNAAAVAVSNLWYPDTRTVSDNVEKLGIQLATDAFSNVLKEFWPDVKRYLHNRRHPNTGDQPTASVMGGVK